MTAPSNQPQRREGLLHVHDDGTSFSFGDKAMLLIGHTDIGAVISLTYRTEAGITAFRWGAASGPIFTSERSASTVLDELIEPIKGSIQWGRLHPRRMPAASMAALLNTKLILEEIGRALPA